MKIYTGKCSVTNCDNRVRFRHTQRFCRAHYFSNPKLKTLLNIVGYIKESDRFVALCKCCGEEFIVTCQNAKKNKSGFCTFCAHTKHNEHKAKLYKVWTAMKQRCDNPNDKKYKDYGGRGIYVCDEWKQDYGVFASWAKSNGHKQGLSIERINNDGPYSPDNCRFATVKEQTHNTRMNKRNKTGYEGVCYDKEKKSWLVQVKHDGERVMYRRYKNIEEAVEERDKFILKNNLPHRLNKTTRVKEYYLAQRVAA